MIGESGRGVPPPQRSCRVGASRCRSVSSYPVNGVTPSVPRIRPSRACVREGSARSSVEVVHLRPEHDHAGHDHDPEDYDDHLEVRFDDHQDREQAADRPSLTNEREGRPRAPTGLASRWCGSARTPISGPATVDSRHPARRTGGLCNVPRPRPSFGPMGGSPEPTPAAIAAQLVPRSRRFLRE